ncbi:MAG: hypothetical protein AB7W16_22300 [Candidatus Obscuribacterales bacterium]
MTTMSCGTKGVIMPNLEPGYGSGKDLSTKDDQSLSIHDAIGIVKDRFKSIDRNGDSFITKEETEALEDGRFTVREKLAIEAFGHRANKLQMMHNDEWGPENDGFTVADLDEFEKNIEDEARLKYDIEARLAPGETHRMDVFGAIIEDNFARIDVDNDKTLSKTELDQFAGDANNPARARQVAAVLSEHFDEFKDLTSESASAGSFEHSLGPFFEEESGKNISTHDLWAFNRLMAHPDIFEDHVSTMRKWEIGLGTSYAAFFGALAAPVAACTVLSPPNFLATAVCGGLTALLGGTAVGGARSALVGETDKVRELYQQRQKMLESWDYFKQDPSAERIPSSSQS